LVFISILIFNFIIFYVYKGNYPWSRILKNNPFRQGTVTKLCIRTPRKPNSARRQCIKVLIKPKFYSIVSIPGRGHTLKKFSHILLKGGGARDLPAVYTQAVRGKYDLLGVFTKKRRRSIYGVSKAMYKSLQSF